MAGRSSDPKDNLKMKPPKGILKSSSSFEAPDGPSGSRKFSKNNKETTFDEMNILETLHPPGKDYGHMKIDEPKTPYERDVPDSIPVDPEDLAKRIAEESQKPVRPQSPVEEEEEESDIDETPEEKEKRRQFEMKRKAHYNEFLMAKKKLQELKDEDDDEDE